MIARILNEGQYRIDDGLRTQLNALDDQAVEALNRNDEQQLDAYLEQMAELVRSGGEPLPPEDLSPSDIIIPPADLTLEETRALFSDEGLIPDLPGVG